MPNAFYLCVCVRLPFCVLSSLGHGSVAGIYIEVPEALCLLDKRGREGWHEYLLRQVFLRSFLASDSVESVVMLSNDLLK